MELDKILVGAISGIFIISLLNPVVSTFGFNKITYMILLYSIPITGMLSVMAVDLFSKRKVGQKVEKDVTRPNLSGKYVIVRTRFGAVHKGRVRAVNEHMLLLDDVMQIDTPESTKLDHLFISKDEIKSIEVSS
ncbi:MAG: hypothetical protein J7L43_01175 [Candidatus Aenigmarchaeota archaeon]|nr:hypothetical protein [Candidatus Aenigmarchaeota archaeon]